jgi:outer membrane protein assembly factor BamB
MVTGQTHRKLEVRNADTGALLWKNEDGLYRDTKQWTSRGVVASASLLAVDGHSITCVKHMDRDSKGVDQKLSAGRILLMRPTDENEKEYGSTPQVWRKMVTIWSVDTPEKTLIKAMVVGGGKVFAACRPGGLALQTGEPGKGEIRAYSAADGKELGQFDLGASPKCDGMAATDGRLFVSLEDGNVVCLAGE